MIEEEFVFDSNKTKEGAKEYFGLDFGLNTFIGVYNKIIAR